MAMTKAERAQFEALQTELALRWPREAEPQPMTREDIKANLEELTLRDQSTIRKTRLGCKGWVFNAQSMRVDRAWSDGTYHGRGNWTGGSASQNCGRIYRTFDEAALAMRWEMCRSFAADLRRAELLAEPKQ